MGLVHEASNKARGVAQAGTALVFGGDQERHPGGIDQAHEELVAVALQMERDLVRIDAAQNYAERHTHADRVSVMTECCSIYGVAFVYVRAHNTPSLYCSLQSRPSAQ